MRKRFMLLSVLAASVAAPAYSQTYDLCAEYWFVRNLAFDRAGYCFGSTLGQAFFDNSDCSTKSPALSGEDQELVAYLRESEGYEGCSVDTAQTSLDVPRIPYWRQIEDLAGPSDTASGCLGWMGPDITLRRAHDPSAPVLYTSQQGNTIVWEYVSFGPEPWAFISLYDGNGGFLGFGWSDAVIDEAFCTSVAG